MVAYREMRPAARADVQRVEEETWKELLRIGRTVARRHTRVRQLAHEERDAAADELIGEWAAELFSNTARLQEMVAKGPALLRTDLSRWLQKAEPVGVEESTWNPYGWVRRKLRAALRSDPSVREIPGRFPMFDLVEPGPARETGVPRSAHEIEFLLPSLPSQLRPQNARQHPPIASADALIAHAIAALELARGPLAFGDLVWLCYAKLDPHPDDHPVGRKEPPPRRSTSSS